MAIQHWSEQYNPVTSGVHPLDVSRLFLHLIPIVLLLTAPALGIFLIFASGPFDLSQITLPGNQQPLSQSSIDPSVSTAVDNVSGIQTPPITGISPLFSKEVQHWGPQIVRWAEHWNLDPNMVATVMQIESCGDPVAQSSAGASGLFQVMPFHFNGGEDHFDPQTNAARGMEYLSKSIKNHAGDIRLTFAGYNAGISGSNRPTSSWANETLRYVYWAVGIYEDATQGKETSDRLAEWMDAGGRSLCRKASTSLSLVP